MDRILMSDFINGKYDQGLIGLVDKLPHKTILIDGFIERGGKLFVTNLAGDFEVSLEDKVILRKK